MSLSLDEVRKVALLARLRLSDEELVHLTPQLAQIVGYVEHLSELDTTGVEPLAHPVELHSVFAEDLPRPSLERSQALANAPKQDGECYRVPAVLGD